MKSHVPTLYFSSQTSTVIPYDFLEGEMVLGNLSAIAGKIRLLEKGVLEISGGVTWKEARAFARSKGRDIMASPTEESACVLAGIATSCTGERSFGFGTLRDQVEHIFYLDFEGEEKVLGRDKLEESELLHAYQRDFAAYERMKNGPCPRLEREIDLMIGMEGQLGVVTKIHLRTVPYEELQYILIPVGKWEESFEKHLDIFNKAQDFRGDILSCELIDHNSLSYLGPDRFGNKDIVVIEIKASSFEKVYEGFLVGLGINLEEIVELSEGDYHHLRLEVPRKIQEDNSRRGIIKKGTDAQVSLENFGKLLEIYQEMGKKGIPYILFGHFGDGHLHFNFLPDKGEVENCEKYLKNFYKEIESLKGSPFAEHGVGIIKQEFIRPFLGKTQFEMFKSLKKRFDPHNQFFPQGFLSL